MYDWFCGPSYVLKKALQSLSWCGWQGRGSTTITDASSTSPYLLLILQVYQMDTGHYLCRNKYYGRSLSIDGFRQALYQFMHNGTLLRKDLFEPILSKLCSLKAVLERQASYRFYSSSLLIIYEGKDPESMDGWQKPSELPSAKENQATSLAASELHTPPQVLNVDVRMIDFAHSTFKGFRDDQTIHDGPDRGYVFGLESLINILQEIREENQ